METVPNTDPRIARMFKATGSRKKSAMISNYTPGSTFLTGWDGGSRDTYHIITKDYRLEPLQADVDPDRMGDPHNSRKVFPPFPENAVAVVRMGTFLGKPTTPHFYLP